ncbi:hypothetical protein BC941DRAFT_472703 [Chlamydoabsidia padenii]|nr:hypothetical protein BC941DRAFT_472703 [Chlamydoabsidia padenii]
MVLNNQSNDGIALISHTCYSSFDLIINLVTLIYKGLTVISNFIISNGSHKLQNYLEKRRQQLPRYYDLERCMFHNDTFTQTATGTNLHDSFHVIKRRNMQSTNNQYTSDKLLYPTKNQSIVGAIGQKRFDPTINKVAPLPLRRTSWVDMAFYNNTLMKSSLWSSSTHQHTTSSIQPGSWIPPHTTYQKPLLLTAPFYPRLDNQVGSFSSKYHPSTRRATEKRWRL